MQELYDEGREALDEDEFRQAERSFTELVKLNGPQTDAALYWTAYAQNREGKKEAATGNHRGVEEALSAEPLEKRWRGAGDRGALDDGRPKSNPEAQNDEDLKLLALQGLMNSSPEKAIPLVEGILNGNGIAAGEIEGTVCAGAEWIAGVGGGSGKDCARPEQS